MVYMRFTVATVHFHQEFRVTTQIAKFQKPLNTLENSSLGCPQIRSQSVVANSTCGSGSTVKGICLCSMDHDIAEVFRIQAKLNFQPLPKIVHKFVGWTIHVRK